MLTSIELEKRIKVLGDNYEILNDIINSSTFEIKQWLPDTDFTQDTLVKYSGNLYIVAVPLSNHSIFVSSDFKQLTNMTNSDFIELIESYFYSNERRFKWIKVDTAEENVTFDVVADDEASFDENKMIKVTNAELVEDIPNVAIGDIVKKITVDTSIYRRKDDSYSKTEINQIKMELETLINQRTHEHIDITPQEIIDAFNLSQGEITSLSSIINDNITGLYTTWSSWYINRQLSRVSHAINGFIGMRKVVVDEKPAIPDPNVMYFIKHGTEYDVTVFLDADDTEGVILNTTAISIEGDEFATKEFVANLYATKTELQELYVKRNELSTVATTGKFSDLVDIPENLFVFVKTTQAQYDAMSDEQKNALVNGVKQAFYIPIV